nr:DNA/RNA non-specific endonuclease [Allomuricauda sp.]
MKQKLSNEKLKNFIRNNATRFLEEDNITSVGLAYKEKNGELTDELCIQFTVGEKIELQALESMGGVVIPKSFEIDGVKVPTDVVERKYETNATLIENLEKVDRKKRIDPILPGASIGHPTISAGTLGCVVFDSKSGQELILSNWHVLHGPDGKIGDFIVQPGSFDDNRTNQNIAGKLVNSHLGIAGDCAVAIVEGRKLNDEIIGLNTSVKKIAEPELGDKVIKSGRTTSVTNGVVSRIHVTVKINYPGIGHTNIGCFEYVPDPELPPLNGEVSMGGDSGSSVMLKEKGKVTNAMLGLHFAGETGNNREHGLACYASSVFKKLGIVPTEPDVTSLENLRLGFDRHFLSVKVGPPSPINEKVRRELLITKNRRVIDYTHFSLVMNKKRKFASWVAWNIDGGNIKKVNRVSFKKDPDFPDGQIGDELYAHNPIDRGHIARRAELCWGSIKEAKQANRDSFFFSNIVPQHEKFNQSKLAGIWGELENAIFDGAKIEDLKVNVMAGPVFDDKNDPVYRNVKIPKEFWKVICYIDEDLNQLVHHAFILTQTDLISGIEGLDLDDFKLFKVPLERITEKTGFKFSDLGDSSLESLDNKEIQKIESLESVLS